jgi:formylglycine-generating enzyme required for sulfatase activity
MRSPLLSTLLLAATSPLFTWANNINVSNVTLTGKNTSADSYQVQFDLSWENSWRTSSAEANYDAAWVFIKYRLDPALPWNHATLSITGHLQTGGSTIQLPADLKGVFIFRNQDGIGNVNYTGLQLRWNYGADGVADNAVVEVRVLAIEMVQIPGGAYFVGDGTTTDVARQFELGQTGAAYPVNSEAAITMGGSAGTNLNARNNTTSGGGSNDDFTYAVTQTLPAAYPKGFAAFYAMKYELTEGQYVDFLNMLTPTQAANRFMNQTGVNGNTVDDNGAAPEIYTTTAPERPCGYQSFTAQSAYADWSALRHMSELEYEKLCRGNRPAVANEYAWGTSALQITTFTFSNVGAANEVITNPGTGAIANFAGTNNIVLRAWRSGIAPASFVGATRVQASAGYYGLMDLTGNLHEMCVSVSNSEGRALTATVHGDGNLAATGVSDIPTWPVNLSTSVRLRGGAYSTAPSSPGILRVSDRRVNPGSLGGTIGECGIRLVRTL